MHIDNIELAEPFKSLFPHRQDLQEKIAASMEMDGFDTAEPLIMWGGILVDGYHRYHAAESLRIFDMPVSEKEFGGEDEAVLYSIRRNATRRHLTDAELANIIQEVDRRTRAAAKEREQAGQNKGREVQKDGVTTSAVTPSSPVRSSADETAAIVGVSRRKVEEVRTIEKHGTEEDMQDVHEGKTTIHKKAEEVKARRKPQRARPEIKDRRTPQMQLFDGAIDNMKSVLNELKAAEWEGINRYHVEQQVSNLLNIVGN